MDTRQQLHFKVCLLGDAGVGKSCLCVRFVRGEFLEGHETTIGASFLTKKLQLDAIQVRLEIWDTAGQERYRSLAPMYWRSAKACLIVFDVTSTESFGGAKKWVAELQRRADPSMVLVLIGNKTDLVSSRTVHKDEADAYAASVGVTYFETSAKTAAGVERIFIEVAAQVHAKLASAAAAGMPTGPRTDTVSLQPGAAAGSSGAGSSSASGKQSGGGCC